ncbi:MAG: hypothetical protein ACM3ZB_05960 [bacterium]
MGVRSCFAVVCLAGGVLAAADTEYTITTIAGGLWAGDGLAATAAQLGAPEGLACDAAGNVYIADALDNRIRVVAPDGRISTWAGTGIRGFSGDGGPASSALLDQPYGLAIDAAGSVYVADLGNARVRRIDADGSIATVAGGGAAEPSDGVAATNARLNQPRNLAFDRAGNLYISEFGGHRVYRLAPDGLLHVVAGTGERGSAPLEGSVPAVEAPLAGPAGLAVDSAGRLLIADSENGVIRVVENGLMSTLASSIGAVPRPVAIAIDSAGAVYVADKFAGAVVRLGPPATDAAARPAVNEPRSLCAGPEGALYVGDVIPGAATAGVVRKIAEGGIEAFAGNGSFRPAGDGGDPALAHFSDPAGVAVDASGAVFVSDAGTGRIRRIAGGTIATAASGLNAPGALAVDSEGFIWVAERGAARVAKLTPTGDRILSVPSPAPEALAPAPGGGVYVADSMDGVVRKISASGATSPVLEVNRPSGLAAGTDGALYVAVPGAVYAIAAGGEVRVAALVETPGRIATDTAGALLVTDPEHHRILRVAPDGTITVLAGMTGVAGFSGDGGSARTALLNNPVDVAAGSAGSIYIADSGNLRIRGLSPHAPGEPEAIQVHAITNAASMLAAPIVPGALVTLFGSGIGPETPLVGGALDETGFLETTLGGFEVRINGRPAPLLYAHSNQVNLQAPYSIAGLPTVHMEIFVDGVRRYAAAAPAAEAAPGIFTHQGGTGQAAALNEDTQPNSADNPAAPGSIVVFWATGEGRRNPPAVEGELAQPPYGRPLLPVTVLIGGRQAEVLYAGASPGFAGLMQINARVPLETAPGPQPVELIIGTARSQPGVTIAIK